MIKHGSLTAPRAFPRTSNKNRDKLEGTQAVPQVLPPLHNQPPAPPQQQQTQPRKVTNQSTSSKPPPKPTVAEPVAQQVFAVAKAPPRPLAAPAQAPKAQQLASATSISCATTLNSSSFVKSCRLSRVCLSLSCSRWELVTRSWRS